MKLVYTARALRHLENIKDYLAERNPEAANVQLRKLVQAVEQLSDFPQMGRLGRRKGTREFPVPPYLIVYRVQGELVAVLSVFDGRRNIGVSYI